MPSTQAASAALQSLARAARSIVLYDAGNATVRHHLGEYQAKMCGALEAHGAMSVAVAPFHLAVGGEIVYEDRDREKSLPFRLHRDGIRRLRIRADVSWAELLELLQILAIRYAAVRDQEEDTVTLLRRAEFKGIEFDSVEGFTPAEELPEPVAGVEIERAQQVAPPAGWDTPLQKLPAPGPLEYRPVPAEALAAFVSEEGADAVGQLAMSLAKDLLTEATRGGWPMPNRDLTAFFAEIRDSMLVDGNLIALRALGEALGSAGASELRDLMMRGLGDARTLDMILDALPPDSDKLPSEYLGFLPLVGVGLALDRLEQPLSEARRGLLVKIVVARLPREADLVMARLSRLDPETARGLAHGVATRAPDRATEVVRRLLAHGDDAVRLQALEVVEEIPGAIPLRPLCALLEDRSEAVRVRAADLLGGRRDESLLDVLHARLADPHGFSPREAEALGRAMAKIAPARARELFKPWLEIKDGLIRRLSAQQRMQQWAAIAGMGLLPGPESEAELRAVAERNDGDVRRHCLATMARRRKEVDARG